MFGKTWLTSVYLGFNGPYAKFLIDLGHNRLGHNTCMVFIITAFGHFDIIYQADLSKAINV